jgi:1L-myo-inositol 1-phosphate cytidylyltransferase / CDP-L-myo-inositol myo-inositolphosphotransferase
MAKTALIFADDAEGLRGIYGIPAVRRLVIMTRRLGFDRINLISRDPGLFMAVSDLIGSDAFYLVENDPDLCEPLQRLNFDENESVLVVKANHVIDRWSLDRLLHAGQSQEIAVLENSEKEADKAIYLVKGSRLLELLASLQLSGRPEAGGEDRAVRVHAGPGLPELLSGGAERVRDAERGLASAVAQSTWHRDSFLSRYLNRPVSQFVSPAISRTGITANMVTLFNALIGLAGAYLIFRGGYLSQIAGSLLFVLCTIVDGIDGEVARLKLQETDFGRVLDITCDNIVHVSLFVAIGLVLYHETGNMHFLYLLWILLIGFGLCALLINRVITGDHTGLQPSRLAVLLEMLLNNRDFAYIVLGFALFHHLEWFFVASAIGIYVLDGILWLARLASRFGGRTISAER